MGGCEQTTMEDLDLKTRSRFLIQNGQAFDLSFLLLVHARASWLVLAPYLGTLRLVPSGTRSLRPTCARSKPDVGLGSECAKILGARACTLSNVRYCAALA